MKELLKVIRARKKVVKCVDTLMFARYDGDTCVEMCMYPKNMLWTNADLLQNQRYGLVLCERSGEIEEGSFAMVDGKLIQGELRNGYNN